MRLVFLSSYFFDKHAGDCEIERKEDRPHARILLSIEGLTFAIPFRSNICHQYAFFTDKKNKCGLDYSKAVLILDENKDIDKSRTPIIRQNEFDALKGKDKVIEQGMRRYLRIYKRAKLDVPNERNCTLVEYSALQYFDKYLQDGPRDKEAI